MALLPKVSEIEYRTERRQIFCNKSMNTAKIKTAFFPIIVQLVFVLYFSFANYKLSTFLVVCN